MDDSDVGAELTRKTIVAMKTLTDQSKRKEFDNKKRDGGVANSSSNLRARIFWSDKFRDSPEGWYIGPSNNPENCVAFHSGTYRSPSPPVSGWYVLSLCGIIPGATLEIVKSFTDRPRQPLLPVGWLAAWSEEDAR